MLDLNKIKLRSAVPVVPGPDGAVRRAIPACDACGTTSESRTLTAIGTDQCATLCIDGHACAKRYRRGTSAESYAAGLRGELLGVAP